MNEPKIRLQQAIDELLPTESPLCVLEAGCGSTSHLRLNDDWRLVGIDISTRQLARNGRLDESIVGDIQTYRWTSHEFDLVVCWDVLEHLENPTAALLNLFSSVKEAGLLVLAMPIRNSLKGVVTQLTPFWFHAWFYRHVIGDKREMTELDQFPTYMRTSMHPRRVIGLGTKCGFTLVYADYYEGPTQRHLRKRSPLADSILSFLKRGCRALTIGTYDPTLSDCILVFKRRSSDRPKTESIDRE